MKNQTPFAASWVLAFLLLVPRTSHARWMNPNTGRFQTMDTFEGNRQDPLSLHKYLYGHSDPVDVTDPAGQEGNYISLLSTITIMTELVTHEIRGSHAALVGARGIFGSDDGVDSLIYGLEVADIVNEKAGQVAAGAGAVMLGYKAIRYGIPALVRGGLKLGRYIKALANEVNNGKVVALGLDPHLEDWPGTLNWTHWIKRGDPEALTKWKELFEPILANRNNRFVFILDDVDVWPGVQRAASGYGRATDYELLVIKENPQWWDRIAWVKDGKVEPNPFNLSP